VSFCHHLTSVEMFLSADLWVILQKVAIFIFQIQKNKTVIGTSLLNSKHSNNIKESEKNMYFKQFKQYMLTYVIIYDLVILFVIPVTLLFVFVQKKSKKNVSIRSNTKNTYYSEMFTFVLQFVW
jgi:hypothetical protein